MRKLMVVLLTLAALWGGYWVVGSRAVEFGFSTWLSSGQDSGLQTRFSELETRGFPNRFDTTIRDLEITSPDRRITWRAPFFQLLALSYRPNHIIGVWPDTQTIELPFETLAISSERMRGSVVFRPETALSLDRSSFEVADLALNSNRGWSVAAQSAQLNTRQTVGRDNTQDIFFQATGLRPPDDFLNRLDRSANLPGTFTSLKIDTTVEFDLPWDRFAVEQRTPRLTNLGVNDFRLLWGKLELGASGALIPDARGFLEGELLVTARNWKIIFQILLEQGFIQEKFSNAIESVLTLMALESGDADTLVTPLIFKAGTIRLGPIPLGPAPNIGRG